MEMHLFVAMVMKMFDLELTDPMPQTVRGCGLLWGALRGCAMESNWLAK